jgi:hypothetical protein
MAVNNPYRSGEATEAEIKEEGLHKENEYKEEVPATAGDEEKEKRQRSVNTQDHGEEDEDDVDPDKAEELVDEEAQKHGVED